MKNRVAPIEPHRDQIEAAYPLIAGLPPRQAKELCRQIYKTMLEHCPVTKTGGISKVQRRVLEVIAEHIDETGDSPTYNEIAQMVGFPERGQAHHTVSSLVRKGFVQRTYGHRGLKILMRPEEI